MKIFLDTSSLIKLYNNETGTAVIQNILFQNSVSTIFLSEIAKVEFVSALLKKARMREMSEPDARRLITIFESDWHKYQFIAMNNTVVDNARLLTLKYGLQGLRTLDSIQFAVAISLLSTASLFVTSDKLLESFFKQEGLPV